MKLLIPLLLIFFVFCAEAQNTNDFIGHSIKGYAQGTTYSIKYYSKEPISKLSIDSILNVIDNSMSIYKTDSNISNFNNPKTRKIKMDEHMKNVVAESFKTYKLTNGYFDITILPLVNLWGFGSKEMNNTPSDADVRNVKKLVGMNFLSSRGDYLKKKRKGISIDVNGIAQGYTVDLLGKYLLSKNITNFIIELGGEIITQGEKPTGDFVVEIQRPNESINQSIYRVKLRNKAITTSGTYEKRRFVDGKFISHHIDPKTGYPVENKIVSVTVVANTALEADAIDNYLMALPPMEAIKFIEKQKNMEVYIVYVENNVFKELESSGFNSYIYK